MRQLRTCIARGRRGFTLLELMLVLAIMVMVAGMAVPAMNEMLGRQKLRSATNSLRTRWDKARLEAMKTGQAQVFECELESGTYSVKPLILGSDSNNAGAGATVISGGTLAETGVNGLLTAADSSLSDSEQLDDGITFHACNVASDARAFAVAQEAQSDLGAVNDLSTANVSGRVIFYPDGSTSSAEAQIKNAQGSVRAVQIRGITGHTRTLRIASVVAEHES